MPFFTNVEFKRKISIRTYIWSVLDEIPAAFLFVFILCISKKNASVCAAPASVIRNEKSRSLYSCHSTPVQRSMQAYEHTIVTFSRRFGALPVRISSMNSMMRKMGERVLDKSFWVISRKIGTEAEKQKRTPARCG